MFANMQLKKILKIIITSRLIRSLIVSSLTSLLFLPVFCVHLATHRVTHPCLTESHIHVSLSQHLQLFSPVRTPWEMVSFRNVSNYQLNWSCLHTCMDCVEKIQLTSLR